MEQNRIIRTALDLGDAGVGEPGEAAGRALDLRSQRTVAREPRARPAAGANSGDRRSSSVSQPGWTAAARRTASTPRVEVARRGRARGRPRTAARRTRARARRRGRSARRPRRRGPRPSARRPRRRARRRAGGASSRRSSPSGSRVVLDAQVDARLPRLAGGGHDEQRRRLAAADVAALGLGAPRARPSGARRGRPSRGREAGRHRGRDRARGPSCWPGRSSASPVDVAGLGDAVRRRCARRRRPRASTTPTWRTARERVGGEHAGQRRRRRPRRAASRSSACGPCAGSTTDCVATAPTPGRAQVHSEPTENQCDCTAAPSSPVSGSQRDDRVGAVRAHAALRAHTRPMRPCRPRARAHPRHARRASCAPTATSRPARRASPAAVLAACDDPTRAVAPDRARRRLARQGRAPARAARGRGRARSAASGSTCASRGCRTCR